MITSARYESGKMTVVRAVLLFLLAAVLLSGETFKLYLKDGNYQLAREYQVEGDRIRYYSTERSQWEEIPKALIDLDRTEKERQARDQKQTREAREQDEEDQAERALRRKIASIPTDPGAYYEIGDQVKALARPDTQIITSKKRKMIQVLAPIPLVPGKATVIIKGEHSSFQVNEARPDFYLRLAKEEQFGIVSLTPKKNSRVVENISIIPVAKQAVEDRKQMETFQQELASGLYRVWPEKPLSPGEYALVEYSDTGDVNDVELLVWDFAYRPGGK